MVVAVNFAFADSVWFLNQTAIKKESLNEIASLDTRSHYTLLLDNPPSFFNRKGRDAEQAWINQRGAIRVDKHNI